jgi:hypothetical protein
MHGGEGSIEQLVIGKWEGKSPFKRDEYGGGGIILKWVLRKCMRVDFEYSCFRGALNDIPVNCVMSR